MNNFCWYETIIPTSGAIRTDINLTEYSSSFFKNESNVEKLFNKEWLVMMEALGLKVDSFSSFYKPKRYTDIYAHIDLNSDNPTDISCVGFNFTLTGSDGMMFWYDIPTNKNSFVLRTSKKAGKRSYKVSDLSIIDKTVIRSDILTVVKNSIPHSNNTNESDRWCISIRLGSKFKDWDFVISQLRASSLLMER